MISPQDNIIGELLICYKLTLKLRLMLKDFKIKHDR